MPTKHDINTLRHWISHPTGGDHFLRGVEGDTYDSEVVPRSDLISMSDNQERDAFTTFLADNILHWWHRLARRCQGVSRVLLQQSVIANEYSQKPSTNLCLDEENAGLVKHNVTKLNAFVRILGTSCASLLPPLSIFVLYFVPNQVDRLGIILAFSALFAFTLSIFSRAKPSEVFAATAA